MTPLSLIAYRLASLLATPLAGPILAMRLRRGKEDPQRIGERRGLTRLARPPGPLVWLHGASVGEAAVLLPFVERITRTGATPLVTTGTLTSAAMLAQRLPPGALHQYAPLDSPLFVRRFLSRAQRDLTGREQLHEIPGLDPVQERVRRRRHAVQPGGRFLIGRPFSQAGVQNERPGRKPSR